MGPSTGAWPNYHSYMPVETDSVSSSCYQLPIVPHVGGEPRGHFSHPFLNDDWRYIIKVLCGRPQVLRMKDCSGPCHIHKMLFHVSPTDSLALRIFLFPLPCCSLNFGVWVWYRGPINIWVLLCILFWYPKLCTVCLFLGVHEQKVFTPVDST